MTGTAAKGSSKAGRGGGERAKQPISNALGATLVERRCHLVATAGATMAAAHGDRRTGHGSARFLL